jgi:hypothetical protein
MFSDLLLKWSEKDGYLGCPILSDVKKIDFGFQQKAIY